MYGVPSDFKLYHYCTYETALKYILAGKSLRLGSLLLTNDPRENRSFIFGVKHNSAGFGFDNDVVALNTYTSNVIRDGCKVICFSRNSILRGYQLSQMWAHYGGKHKGICIEIDYKVFVTGNPDFIRDGNFKKVTYINPESLKTQIITDRYKQIDLTAPGTLQDVKGYLNNEFRMEHRDYLFFTKSIEWEHEQEFRLLYFSENKDSEYCTIEDSLSAIYLGVDFDLKNVPEIKNVLGVRRIPVWPVTFSGEWLSVNKNLNE